MKKVSIRITILSMFLALAFVLLSLAYIAQYDFAKTMSEKSASEQFNIISTKLNEKLRNLDSHIVTYINVFLSDLENKTIEDIFKNQKQYLKMYSSFLEGNDNTYSVYLGTKDDKFFEVINLNANEILRKNYNASPSDRWLIISLNHRTDLKTLTLYDENLNQTSKTTQKTSYEPSKRPWFKLGMKANGDMIKSDPYMFASIKTEGLTYSIKSNENSVFCIDILMQDMNEMLKIKQNFKSHINSYIVNANKIIIASSNKKMDTVNHILKNINLSDTNINGNRNIENADYAYNVEKINDNYIISIANLTAISKSYRDIYKKYALTTLILSLLLLPMVWYMSSYVVSPILQLSKESKKIAKREYDDIQKIDSKISEISQLSNSIFNMSNSIKNHQEELEQKVQERTKELKKLSVTDKLTGVFNRIKIDESLTTETLKQNRYGHEFGVILMDIDHFKSVNDTHGHQVGDKVLKEFATILKNGVRKTDVVGRWGGEEFIVICIEINEQNLLKLAEKLRTEIEKTTFTQIGKKTASFGVVMRKKNEKIEQFINRVDMALYEAKNRGRNRVEKG